MTRVIWTRQAVEDVEAIKAYVARDSEHYAVLLAERLVAAVARLQRFPQSGRVVPEVGDDSLRSSFVRVVGRRQSRAAAEAKHWL